MNDWKDVAKVLLGSWPSQVASWGKDAIGAYISELQSRGVQPEQAIIALRSSESPFPPSAGQVVNSARVDPHRPTFDEAYLTIYRAAARQQLPEAHPLIIGFIERQGLSRLGSLQLDHPDHGELVRKQLGEAWEQHVEAFDGREIHSIAAGEGIRRLDPASTLGLTEGR